MSSVRARCPRVRRRRAADPRRLRHPADARAGARRRSCRSPRPCSRPASKRNSDKLFVVVTFSGGGKRAAAFSYGVLEALRDIKVTTPDGEQHSLLDEIDLISAVSGGAFTAAYYAMNGHETFDSYAPRFLNHDTEKDLWHKVLKPSSWPRLAKPLVSRSDLEVEYFDEELFKRRHGVRRDDAFAARDHHRHRPGARQTVRVHARAAERHLRRPEERAAGARGVRLGRDAHLLRAAGHAHLRGATAVTSRRSIARRRSRATDDVYRRERAERLLSFLDSQELSLPAPRRRRVRRQSRRARHPRRGGARRHRHRRAAAQRLLRARAACCSSSSTRAPASIDATRRSPEPLGIKKVMDAVVSATFNRYSFETMNLMRAAREALGDGSAQPRAARPRSRFPTATSSTSTWSSCRSIASRTRRNANTWIAFPRRSRCRPSRSSGCAAPHTCWSRNRPSCATSSRNPPAARQRSEAVGARRHAHK